MCLPWGTQQVLYFCPFGIFSFGSFSLLDIYQWHSLLPWQPVLSLFPRYFLSLLLLSTDSSSNSKDFILAFCGLDAFKKKEEITECRFHTERLFSRREVFINYGLKGIDLTGIGIRGRKFPKFSMQNAWLRISEERQKIYTACSDYSHFFRKGSCWYLKLYSCSDRIIFKRINVHGSENIKMSPWCDEVLMWQICRGQFVNILKATYRTWLLLAVSIDAYFYPYHNYIEKLDCPFDSRCHHLHLVEWQEDIKYKHAANKPDTISQ